ncbi:MAG TPA: AraC family transcriptional regulator [Streptomyces sp.]|uniref:AraC family transcriptional regulator n=1 Tax=Streptomyces sp. TaxID=1931 RepID=UPI002D6B607B|nr:AraC family transcriptional regulator [Streptomyces sp.]HZG02940.1 AraC family transcriptional regulator [Streptomyces sp.]
MDVVSDAVASIRTGRPHAARTRRTAPWGLRFPAARGTGFHVVLQGRCRLLFAGCDPVPLGAGDVVLVPHGHEIALADSPDSKLVDVAPDMDDSWVPAPDTAGSADELTVLMCGSYQLDRAGAHPLLAELPAFVHLPQRVGGRTALDAVVDLLGAELDRRRPGTDAAIPALLDAMLLYILRTWYQDHAPRSAGGWAAALNDPAVGSALQHMHAEPATAWTVERLSRRAGLSRAAFSRRFTELVGRPPMAYLTWWRMTTAARILRGDDAPLQAVAERVGYSSEFAFNRAFKREFGVSPGTYRRQGAGRQDPARRDHRAPRPGAGYDRSPAVPNPVDP